MVNAREILNDLMNGVGGLAELAPEAVAAYQNSEKAAYEVGVLPVKTKELISVAIGAYNRCQYCIVAHVYGAYRAGATKEEILDAAMTVVNAFGSGPSIAYTGAVLLAAANEFENDFK